MENNVFSMEDYRKKKASEKETEKEVCKMIGSIFDPSIGSLVSQFLNEKDRETLSAMQKILSKDIHFD